MDPQDLERLEQDRALRRRRLAHGRSVLIKRMAFVIAAWFLFELIAPQCAVPPSSVTTFDQFVEWKPRPRLSLNQRGDETVLVAVGGFNGLALRSGPPCYVFDRTGRLIEWSRDMGDDSRFSGRGVPLRRALTIDDARAWMNSGSSPSAPASSPF